MVEDNVHGLSLHCSYHSFIGQIARKAGVAPGIFRRGVTPPTRGLKYGFQSNIDAKNLRKIAFHLPTGG